jgi:hypothetical protein
MLSQRRERSKKKPHSGTEQDNDEFDETPGEPAITEVADLLAVPRTQPQTGRPRGFKFFRKVHRSFIKPSGQYDCLYGLQNVVAGLCYTEPSPSASSMARRVVIHMDQLAETFPKESERELQLRLQWEKEEQERAIADKLFQTRFVIFAFTDPPFHSITHTLATTCTSKRGKHARNVRAISPSVT